MSSQVIDSKKDAPLYEYMYLQEKAFQIPDKFMLQPEIYWCPYIKNVIEVNKERPWGARLENAVFFGSPTGMSRHVFGYGNPNQNKSEYE